MCRDSGDKCGVDAGTCRLVEKTAPVKIDNEYGQFDLVLYVLCEDGARTEHLALYRNLEQASPEDPPILRLNSACITSEVFHDRRRCDCGWQLHSAMRAIDEADCGIIVYHCSHEGRGLGLATKLKSFHVMERDNVSSAEAHQALGVSMDARSYSSAAVILEDLGITRVRLLTNNPAKSQALQERGITVKEVSIVRNPTNAEEKDYLNAKRDRMGHAIRWRSHMKPFADRLLDAIDRKGNPCVVGLDPRVDLMPDFITSEAQALNSDMLRAAGHCIAAYHKRIIGLVADLVPAVKLQIAFYEKYGSPGLVAFAETIDDAKRNGLMVIVDAKRNDIASTAQAYADALLGHSKAFGVSTSVFDADCITVSPYLGLDSLEPFVETCREYGKGIFVLVKTSNPGSADFQDLLVESGKRMIPLYEVVAEMVNRCASGLIGDSGYSSIGAVVGATFPAQAQTLRSKMPQSILLVPGYGAQGGTAEDVVPCFNEDGLGAVVNASRSLTYNFDNPDLGESDFDRLIRTRTTEMVRDIQGAISAQRSQRP